MVSIRAPTSEFSLTVAVYGGSLNTGALSFTSFRVTVTVLVLANRFADRVSRATTYM